VESCRVQAEVWVGVGVRYVPQMSHNTAFSHISPPSPGSPHSRHSAGKLSHVQLRHVQPYRRLWPSSE